MIKIDFITSRKSAGAEIAYPLIKWRRLLRGRSLDIRIAHFLDGTKMRKPDVLILTHPYYRDQFKNNSDHYQAVGKILLRDACVAKKYAEKVLFFDTTDSTASPYLHLLGSFDMMLKWQLLVNRSYYSSEDYEERSCIWVEEQQRFRHRADPDELHKLAIGWNLAYRNYSVFRKGARHLHWRGITWDSKFTAVDNERPLLCSFRGKFSGIRGKHRQKAVEAMRDPTLKNVVQGAPINRWRYLQEFKRSKVVVSPFGYGEPCHRDMEAFIHGAILVKPSMDHLETFPNVYHPGETYVPVRWDFEDLSSRLKEIDNNYPDFRHVAERGQTLYREFAENGEHFVAHLESIIDRLYG